MVLVALGAIAANSDDATLIGPELNELTKGGEKCTTFAQCKALLEDDVDIDYDGVSGPLEFGPAGEPTQASILILEFDEAGVLQVVDSIQGSIDG
jgi:branched-chain amino acid transport system substrate-binding protein